MPRNSPAPARSTSLLALILTVTSSLTATSSSAQPETLTFARVIELAQQQAPDAYTAQARIDVARAQQDATNASRLPTIGLSSSLSPTVQYTAPLLAQDKEALCSANSVACSVGSVPVGSARTGVSIDARWRIFDFGATGAAIDQSSEGVTAATARSQSATARGVATALKIFLAVVADDQLVVARERLASDRARQAEVVKARADLGEGVPSDVLQAEVAAEAAALDLESAKAQARTDRITLAGALGLPPSDTIVVSGDLDLDVVRGADDAIHPDVKAADADVRSAGFGITRAERSMWPTIDGSASIGASLVALTRPDANLTPSAGFGLSLQWPWLDFGKQADISAANASRIVAERTRDAQQTAITTERARALVALDAQGALVIRAGRLQASARQAVDVVEARVQVGEGRLAELLDAQATLTQAEASLVTARANRAQAAVDVALASGVVDSGAFVVAPAR